jgi:hypothetical protein
MGYLASFTQSQHEEIIFPAAFIDIICKVSMEWQSCDILFNDLAI